MKTKEELNAIKEEVEALNKKLAELSENELTQVTGGLRDDFMNLYDIHDLLLEKQKELKEQAENIKEQAENTTK